MTETVLRAPRRVARTLSFGLVLLSLVVASTCAASPFDIFGVGAKGVALTGAMSAQRADYAATHYNPAGLTGADGPQVGFGIDLVAPALNIAFHEQGNSQTDLPSLNTNLHVGALFPLGAHLGNRFALGVLISTPLRQVTRIDVFDRTVPHFYRFESQTESVVFEFGVAARLFDWVSVGLGVHGTSSLSGGSTIELDLATRRFLRDELEAQVSPSKAMTAGLSIHPSDDFTVAVSYRQPFALTYELAVKALINDVGYLDTLVRGEALYRPERVLLGGQWRMFSPVRVMLDLVWERWSAAPDPTGSFVGELNGGDLGLGDTLYSDSSLALAAVDTLSPHLGVEWTVASGWIVRAGYAHLPTPLPVQSESQNYADADVHQVGVGAAWRFGNPWARNDGPLSIELSGQLGLMERREMNKRDPEDPVGSYTIDGNLWHMALTLRQDIR
jgi:long-chain fatty acid transport protein